MTSKFKSLPSGILQRIVFCILIGFAIAQSSKAQPAFLQDGLVAYYPLNGHAKDVSGNGRDGIIIASGTALIKPDTDRFGNPSSALIFPGNGSAFVDIRNKGLSAKGNADRCVSVWVKMRNEQPWAYIFSSGTPKNNQAFNFRVGHESSITFNKVSVMGYNYDHAKIDAHINEGWNHLVVSLRSGVANFYLNGLPVGSTNMLLLNTTGDQAFIGVNNDNYNTGFSGSMDDFRIYDRSLTDSEIKSLYNYESAIIINQPENQSVTVGSSTAFCVNVKDGELYNYRWQRNEQDIPGATSNCYTEGSVTKSMNGNRYRVIISNSRGAVISDSVILTVSTPPPTIVTQPVGKAPSEGTQLVLSVTASGVGTLTYQWQLNQQNIPGATSSSLLVSAVRSSANGRYRVIVGNQYGTTISTEVTVTVVVTDSDSDGLSDYEEILSGTNPTNPDTDGDGLNDFSEVKTYGSNPLTTDTDGDGYSDGIEVARDGNPKNPNITPTGALAIFPAVDVEFYTLTGVKYQLEVSTDMNQWTPQGGVVVGNGNNQNHLVRASKATSFWRLKVVQ
jgi:hypothetical protein